MIKFSAKNYLILILLLLSVISIRFDRNDFLIKKYTSYELGDSQYYTNYVENFKYSKNLLVGAPFGYRPLVPYIASLMPLNSRISINIVNALIMVLSLLTFISVLKRLLIKEKLILYSGMLFILSFPTFYYSTIGIVDPIGLLGIIFSFYLVVSGRDVLLPFSVAFFTFGKETVLFVLPICFLFMWFEQRKFIRALIINLISFGAYLLSMYIIKHYIYPTNEAYFWVPSMNTFLSNIIRPRAVISFILSFGIPGAISLYILFRIIISKNRELMRIMLVYYLAILEFILLYIYSLFSAYSDGRFIWPGMFFSIIIYAIYNNKKFIGKINYK